MTDQSTTERWNELRNRMTAILDRPGAPTQTELGKRPGITQSSLSKFLNSKAEVLAMDTIAAFADAVGTTVGALWGESSNGAGDTAGLVIKTYSALTESLINPRGTFDEDALQELKASIAAHGLLQNLVITPGAKQDVIVAGARRHRAIGLLVKEKAAIAGVPAGNYPIPCRVVQADDIEQRLLAITENLQRDEIAPIDEARAYAWLRAEAGWSTEQIAERIHKTQRYVQKRIALVEHLGEEALAALQADEITLAAAQALTIAPVEEQPEAVEAIKTGEWGFETAADIRRSLTEDKPEVGDEAFPIERYTGAIVQLDDETRWFSDVAQFQRLQREAAEATVAELRETWLWADLIVEGGGERYQSWEYTKSDDKTVAGCIVEIGRDHQLAVHEGLVKPAPAASASASTSGGKTTTPKPHFPQKHLQRAKHVKTLAMQRAVLGNRGAALRLCVLGLIGGDVARVSLGAAQYGEPLKIDPAVHEKQISLFPKLASKALIKGALDIVTPLAEVVSYRTEGKEEDVWRALYAMTDEEDVWRALYAMTDAQVLDVLAALMAAQVGSWAGYNPTLGDTAATCAIAEDLGVDMTAPAKAQLGDDDYLKSAGKRHLLEIIADNGLTEAVAPAPEKTTQKAMREKLIPLVEAGGLDGYVPRELRFGSEADLAKAAPKAKKGKKAKEPA